MANTKNVTVVGSINAIKEVARLRSLNTELLVVLNALVGYADCVLAEPTRFGGIEAARNFRGPLFDDARALIAKAEGK